MKLLPIVLMACKKISRKAVFAGIVFLLLNSVVNFRPYGLWQEPRRQELTQIVLQASNTPLHWMTKSTGAGAADVKSLATNGLEKAAWNDDQGVYLSAAFGAAITRTNLNIDVLLSVTQSSLYLASLFFLSRVLSSYLKKSLTYSMSCISIFVLGYLKIFKQLPMTVYGKNVLTGAAKAEGLGIGDLFYGLQSAASLLTLSVGLVVISQAAEKKRGLSFQVAVISFLLAFAELFRSGSLVSIGAVLLLLFCASLDQSRRKRELFAAFFGTLISSNLVKLLVVKLSSVLTLMTSGISLENYRVGHSNFHNLYLGLSYTRSRLPLISGEPGNFGIVWDDNFIYSAARRFDQNMILYSSQYEGFVRNSFWQIVNHNRLEFVASIFWRLVESIQMLTPELVGAGIVFLGLCLMKKKTNSSLYLLDPKFWLLGLCGSLMGPSLTMPLYNYLGFSYVITGVYTLFGSVKIFSWFLDCASERRADVTKANQSLVSL